MNLPAFTIFSLLLLFLTQAHAEDTLQLRVRIIKVPLHEVPALVGMLKSDELAARLDQMISQKTAELATVTTTQVTVGQRWRLEGVFKTEMEPRWMEGSSDTLETHFVVGRDSENKNERPAIISSVRLKRDVQTFVGTLKPSAHGEGNHVFYVFFDVT